MCGIAGIRRFDGQDVDVDVLRRMTAQLAHRGPDGEGHLVRGSVGLGHRRLSIIDVAHSAQPMSSADATSHLCFNGEILNYAALRETLDYPFRTPGDTETLLALHVRHGIDAAKQLLGQFAYAWYDEVDDDLWLVRDRVGILPLYYYQDASVLAYASEIKALLPALPEYPGVDHDSVLDFLSLRSVPAPFTLHQGIRKLPPGHVLQVGRSGAAAPRRYWDLPDVAQVREEMTPEDAVDALGRALRTSIRRNLVADVPVGSYLSGGVDSSLIVALAAEARDGQPLDTFTAGFGDPRFDELPHARAVSELLGTRHHEVRVDPDDFMATWEHLTWHRDAPVSQTSDVAVYRLAELARQHVTVALSGEGSDELFGGYPKHRFAAPTARAGLLPTGLRNGFLRPVERALPRRAAKARIGLRALTGRTERARYEDWFASFTSEEVRSLQAGPQRSRGSQLHPGGPLRRMLALDTTAWLPDNLLERGDRMSMANSLELRPPFLDADVVELAFTMPDHVKLRDGQGKWVVKQLARQLLPSQIVDRPKSGFKVPTDAWFRTGLRAFAYDKLLSADSFVLTLFSAGAIRRILDDHVQGRRDEELRIWTLLSLEVWHDVFYGATARDQRPRR